MNRAHAAGADSSMKLSPFGDQQLRRARLCGWLTRSSQRKKFSAEPGINSAKNDSIFEPRFERVGGAAAGSFSLGRGWHVIA
jgi:hypothetical protein